MVLKFFGTLKDGCDASSVFKKFRLSDLHYEVDLVAKHLIVKGFKPENKYAIMREVYKIFEVTSIETRMTARDIESSDEMLFEELRATLLGKQLSQYVTKRIIQNMILETNAIGTNRKNVKEGEIVSCDFGFSLLNEVHGRLNVVVLRHTEKNKYLVAPIVLNATFSDDGIFCMKIRRNIDATYYSDTYKKDEAIILLNRLQEVNISRLDAGFGTVTKYFLNSIFKRLYFSTYKNLSLNTVVEELLSPAVKCMPKEEAECQQLESFFEFVKIPNEMMFLRECFLNALASKSATLKDLIPQLQINNSTLSKNAVQTKLRAEFVTWINSIYPDIFEEYDRISLADILKVFLKCYNELN